MRKQRLDVEDESEKEVRYRSGRHGTRRVEKRVSRQARYYDCRPPINQAGRIIPSRNTTETLTHTILRNHCISVRVPYDNSEFESMV